MRHFYQIFIQLFRFSLPIAVLFNKKAKVFVAGRKNIFEDIASKTTQTSLVDSKLIWIHCASLGEFEQVRPLMEQMKTTMEKLKIFITFFSPSGYEQRKNYEGADFIFYLPVDTRSNVKKFLDVVKPFAVVFVKYDFWYNYLHELRARSIPVYLVSANFREDQFSGFYGRYLRKVLTFFNHIFVQNENSGKLLSEKGVLNVTVSGDIRFDKVAETALHPKKMTLIEHFKNKKMLFIAGSSWQKDEEMIAACTFFNTMFKLIIAPHQVEEAHIKKILSLFPVALRYSIVSKEPATIALDKLESASVLVIDNIGMLSNLYQYADIAYIGGGFGEGIHNILEAVAFGVPVIYGPNHTKFPEANELEQLGGAFSIADANGFNKSLELLLSDTKVIQMASLTCRNFVKDRGGATEKIISGIKING